MADVAAKAADAAGPLAHKVADVTTDVGAKLAERSRGFATDLRRAGDSVVDAAGDAADRVKGTGNGDGPAKAAAADALDDAADQPGAPSA